jgi:hypothetical protein
MSERGDLLIHYSCFSIYQSQNIPSREKYEEENYYNFCIIFGNLRDFKKPKALAGLQGMELMNIKTFPFHYKKERSGSFFELIKIKDPAPFLHKSLDLNLSGANSSIRVCEEVQRRLQS